jgi:hypothetical protein
VAADTRLIELARQYTYARAFTILGTGSRNLARASAVLLAALGLVAMAISPSVPQPFSWVLVIVTVFLFSIALLLLIATLSQPSFEKWALRVERLGRAIGLLHGLSALALSVAGLWVIAQGREPDQRLGFAIGGLLLTLVASFFAGSVIDMGRGMIRSDRASAGEWDYKVRTLVFWLSLVAVLWPLLQISDLIGTALDVAGAMEFVLILAVPFVFAYVTQLTDVRIRLRNLVLVFGELEEAAGAATRARTSQIRIDELARQFVKVQVLLHGDNRVTLARFRTRIIVDPQLVDLLDLCAHRLCDLPVPPRRRDRQRGLDWLRPRLDAVASTAGVAVLARELQIRAVGAARRF